MRKVFYLVLMSVLFLANQLNANEAKQENSNQTYNIGGHFKLTD
jgi:hypothetical protein